ncbi:MAG: N-6 DNA methylase [Proteobacteria bacterium]|nr:N-6 DNA methylase [Pseudomonadota bacterium]
MPNLNWNEIRNRATQFAHEWRDATSERAEAQTFWNEFFAIFGVKRRSVAVYEKRVQKLPNQGKTGQGRIDLFWPGTLLAEHKSAGQDLNAAHTQALDYFLALTEAERPRYVVVSDFQRFRVYDLDENTEKEFALEELPANIAVFGFIAGYTHVKLRDEPQANIEAVEKLGALHDALKRDGYGLDVGGHAGHPLQVFLVRVLFCLFADDTGLFTPKDSFLDLIENTREDGSDTGATLAHLFQILNIKPEARQRSIAETFSAFPYVNGRLFEEALPIPDFDSEMRALLLECCRLQWAGISPAIFGAMFQKIIELDAKDRRRQLGAHYTSEANILKLIGPLFLDELRAEFERVRNDKNALFAFHKNLRTLNFLDPACGCGNFLVITYRELRRLELDVLLAAKKFGNVISGVFQDVVQVNVDQFHGIEIEEFPAQVAQVAMWLTDHQMNLEAGREFEYFNRLPLEKSANIRHGNALRLDWEGFVPPQRLNYILGNPPFAGKKEQNDEQKEDLQFVVKDLKGAGVLDYVACWYLKAAQYLSGSQEGFVSRDKRRFDDVRFGKKVLPIDDTFVTMERETEAARGRIRCAFVSTNSITQGEQVGVLWSEMFRRGMKIRFAHRTFKWSNEAPGKAAVHCVIIGFGREDALRKRLFDYAEVDGPAHETQADNINPYLLDAPDTLINRRYRPLCEVPILWEGITPLDNGFLSSFTQEEMKAFIAKEPKSKKWFRLCLTGNDYINGIKRYCLWLVDASPAALAAMPEVMERITKVRNFRLKSKSSQAFADTPSLFRENKIPQRYLLVPKTSSERRRFVPMGFVEDCIATNSALYLEGATLYHFGAMNSTMHMAWVRYVCGRLKSDFRYSAQIVYNNFPWPQKLGDKHRVAIEAAAQAVLDTRAEHPDATLAQLYDPNTMPPNLVKAHAELDRAVDVAYVADGGARKYSGDAERVAFLFKRYNELTSLV